MDTGVLWPRVGKESVQEASTSAHHKAQRGAFFTHPLKKGLEMRPQKGSSDTIGEYTSIPNLRPLLR